MGRLEAWPFALVHRSSTGRSAGPRLHRSTVGCEKSVVRQVWAQVAIAEHRRTLVDDGVVVPDTVQFDGESAPRSVFDFFQAGHGAHAARGLIVFNSPAVRQRCSTGLRSAGPQSGASSVSLAMPKCSAYHLASALGSLARKNRPPMPRTFSMVPPLVPPQNFSPRTDNVAVRIIGLSHPDREGVGRRPTVVKHAYWIA